MKIINDDIEVEKENGKKIGEIVNEVEEGSCLIMVQQTMEDRPQMAKAETVIQ